MRRKISGKVLKQIFFILAVCSCVCAVKAVPAARAAEYSSSVIAGRGETITVSDDSRLVITDGKTGLEARGSSSTITAGSGIFISTDSSSGRTVFARGNNSLIDIGNNAKIFTFGVNSQSISARGENSGITIGNNAYISTTGNTSHGVYTGGAGASVKIGENAVIITSGDGSHSAFVRGSKSNVTIGGNAVIYTSGTNAYGVYASGMADGDGDGGSACVGAGAAIVTRGRSAHGVYARNGGKINLAGATISVKSHSSYTSNAIASFTDTSWDSVVAGDGVFTIQGNILSVVSDSPDSGKSQVSLTMRDGSDFTGSTGYRGSGATLDLTLLGANSFWNVTGNSELTRLSLGGAVVHYGRSALGTTITADKLASGKGSFAMGVAHKRCYRKSIRAKDVFLR